MVSSKIKTLPETFCGVPRLIILYVIIAVVFTIGFSCGVIIMKISCDYSTNDCEQSSYDLCEYANDVTNLTNTQTIRLAQFFEEEYYDSVKSLNCSIYKR